MIHHCETCKHKGKRQHCAPCNTCGENHQGFASNWESIIPPEINMVCPVKRKYYKEANSVTYPIQQYNIETGLSMGFPETDEHLRERIWEFLHPGENNEKNLSNLHS